MRTAPHLTLASVDIDPPPDGAVEIAAGVQLTIGLEGEQNHEFCSAALHRGTRCQLLC